MRYKFLTKLTLFTLLISFISPLYAGEGTKLSLVATPQFSWFKTDNKNIDDGSSVMGFNFGMNIDKFFASNYAFTTGLTINNSGGKLTYNFDNSQPDFNGEMLNSGDQVKFKLSYIEIPLGIKLKTNEFRRSTFFGQFGLNPMVNIKAEDGNNNNISDEINLINMAYHIGGGVEYSIGGNTALTAGIIYKNGFLDITDNHGVLGEKTVMHSINFKLGILF